jgi:hypothetical protein
MRLFKANPSYQSEEDRAAGLRLESIASRYRVEPDPVEQASIEIVPANEEPDSPEPLY